MQVGDRVTWNPAFVEKLGDRFPWNPREQGEVTEVGDNKLGQQMCMVEWDELGLSAGPQIHPATHLRKV